MHLFLKVFVLINWHYGPPNFGSQMKRLDFNLLEEGTKL